MTLPENKLAEIFFEQWGGIDSHRLSSVHRIHWKDVFLAKQGSVMGSGAQGSLGNASTLRQTVRNRCKPESSHYMP